MDAFRALDTVGLGDREIVRAALRATAVKRAVDLPTFERLFELFFSGMGEVIREVTAATEAQLGEIEHGFQEGRFTHALAGALGLGDLGAELERLRRDLAGNAPDM